MVERDPTLCELHNRDVGNMTMVERHPALCGWSNFRIKS
jgi:hypothetical protein